jgi:hypothetical protein
MNNEENKESMAVLIKTGNLTKDDNNYSSHQQVYESGMKRSTSHVWIQPNPNMFESIDEENDLSMEEVSNQEQLKSIENTNNKDRVTVQLYINSNCIEYHCNSCGRNSNNNNNGETSCRAFHKSAQDTIRQVVYQILQDLNISKIELLVLKIENASQICCYWKEMENLIQSGFINSIGVCDLTKNELIQLKSNCNIKPQVVQINFLEWSKKYHHNLSELVRYCDQHDIRVISGSTLGNSIQFTDNETKNAAKRSLDTQNESDIEIKWVVKYASYSYEKSVVNDTGYIVKAQKSLK